ncbi:vacuolar cation/proton exchanger 3-like [Ananas comosus]|uniref:Vacuolar cation/proton exchanger n=1 Tax=Ananas comosus TaxID=4615 RepID=A0A6P5FBK1_ANACO|nr:vacuolar cation/proton exchanger 3-like [Ananas comosus]
MEMEKINQKTQMATLRSNPEIVSLDGRLDEFEDESLVSPVAHSRKPSGFEGTHRNSFSVDKQECTVEYLKARFFRSLKIVLFTAKINMLMPCGLIAVLINYITGDHGWVFFLSLLGIIPFAERLGFATEQLALFTGPTVGGLLNATFGNATELIISIHALRNGMLRVVQQSLLGSILSNMLLVLGCAFFSGGIVFIDKKEQVFNKASAVMNSGLLLMAVMGLLFPAVLHYTHTEVQFGKSELALSRFSSCIMLVAYASYLFFQLKSQEYLDCPVNEGGSPNEQGADDEESAEISKWEAIIWLAVLTAWISVLSEYLVDAIEGASTAWRIPVAFISVVLLPIVGNAAEHASAIMFAMKDKLDISLGVAIGSSTQISMFGIPFCVVIGWMMGQPMDLNFQLFETATLFITVIVVAFMLQDGTSNYFKGLMLILCYLIVAASFFVHVDPTSAEDAPPRE